MNKEQAGIYNQAAMEFGSLQCKPVKPLCNICPLQSSCIAYASNLVHLLPVKIKSKKVRERYFNFILVIKDGQVLMQKRKAKDIWLNLYQLPLFETENPVDPVKLLQDAAFTDSFGPDVKIINV